GIDAELDSIEAELVHAYGELGDAKVLHTLTEISGVDEVYEANKEVLEIDRVLDELADAEALALAEYDESVFEYELAYADMLVDAADFD
ncbi:hypothetical protein NL489_27975, partial [Klebsiella pneumoniae]|nr:hypothetical protein [Klebsiella pneumoniae]